MEMQFINCYSLICVNWSNRGSSNNRNFVFPPEKKKKKICISRFFSVNNKF